jgi:hypothetical protein
MDTASNFGAAWLGGPGGGIAGDRGSLSILQEIPSGRETALPAGATGATSEWGGGGVSGTGGEVDIPSLAGMPGDWRSDFDLDRLDRRRLVSGGLYDPTIQMDVTMGGSCKTANVQRTVQRPRDLDTIPGLYPPGSIVFIKRECETRRVYQGRGLGPTLISSGHELYTVPMLNHELAAWHLNWDSAGSRSVKPSIDAIANRFAIDGAVQTIEGDSGAPHGAYRQGSMTTNAAITEAGPAVLYDIWNASVQGALAGQRFYLILRLVDIPENALDFAYSVDPSGTGVSFSKSDFIHKGIKRIYQVMPYMDGAAGRFPPMEAYTYLTDEGLLECGIVYSVGTLEHGASGATRDTRGLQRGNQILAKIGWPDRHSRSTSSMITATEIHAVMGAASYFSYF